MKLGLHVSIQGGVDKAVDRAVELGCDTFQIFTRNPRSWRINPLKEEVVEAFKAKLRESGIGSVYSHLPYIQNLATSDQEIYEKSIASLDEEFNRCEALGIPYIVTHLGSHLGTGTENGIRQIVNALRQVLGENSRDIMILLENSGGAQNQVGSHMDELQTIIEGVGDPRVGVCFDTCHAFVAGFNLKTGEGLEATLRRIDETIGFEALRLVHLNDSVGAFNSGRDHHQHIGLGEIGEEGMRLILGSRLSEKPMIMETPIDEVRDDRGNMEKARELAKPASRYGPSGSSGWRASRAR